MSAAAKRYHLFGYNLYEAGGGMNDYKGSFASLEAAANFIRSANSRSAWHLAVVNERGDLEETLHDWLGNDDGWRELGG